MYAVGDAATTLVLLSSKLYKLYMLYMVYMVCIVCFLGRGTSTIALIAAWMSFAAVYWVPALYLCYVC